MGSEAPGGELWVWVVTMGSIALVGVAALVDWIRNR